MLKKKRHLYIYGSVHLHRYGYSKESATYKWMLEIQPARLPGWASLPQWQHSGWMNEPGNKLTFFWGCCLSLLKIT